MLKTRVAAVLLFAAVAGTSFGADDRTGVGSTEFSINPGVALMGSDYQKNSFSLDVSALKRVHEVVSIGPEVGYLFGSKIEGTVPGARIGDLDNDGRPDSLNVTSDVHARILHLAPEIKLGPNVEFAGYHWNPYVVGGGGYYWTHYTGGTLTATGRTSGGLTLNGAPVALASSNDHNGGWNIGGGLSMLLPQNFALGFEVRYHRIVYKSQDDVTWVTPAFRLTLYF